MAESSRSDSYIMTRSRKEYPLLSRRTTRSNHHQHRNLKDEDPTPDVESLLLGPPPITIMNMSNPLSDPNFNETYQHYSLPTTPSSQAEKDEAKMAPSPDSIGGGSSSGMIVMNMTNPLSDPAFNETYQHYYSSSTNPPTNPSEEETVAPSRAPTGGGSGSSGMIIMNMTNPLSDPEFNSTYQHSSGNLENASTEHNSIVFNSKTASPTWDPKPSPHSPATEDPTPNNPSIRPTSPMPPPQKPAATTGNVQCTQTTGLLRQISCRANTFSQNHPIVALFLVCAFAFGTIRWVRNNRRRSLSRGEYRAVAAHYIEHDFDDSLREDEFEEEDEGWSSSGKRTIEMASFGDEENGGLTLEEVNG